MRKLEVHELNRLDVEEFKRIEKHPVVIVLDNVRSQNNIGSVFRTADAFRIEKVVLTGICSTPPNKEIHKTALGAENSVEWEYFDKCTDAVESLKNAGYTIVSIEQVEGSISLEKFTIDQNAKYALVLGNEVKGVDQEVVQASDCAIEIPQEGTKHSLNVSITAGIVMWEFFRKFSF
ncbi:RNA methyltransferase [uncultured Acetobacteroides sp.]|uniref:RNA methyltransferase n=1 Tax=uncultured Acetobacteroides sp. TaxID=1760811 RepID=UPI0029F559C2|nr:RNA methyltransferase [uncultured Acetobacteroides sp.]